MIIGLTGSLAAGKGVVSEFLKEKGFVYLSLSDELREIAKQRKIELTRENLQNLGNDLRKEKGNSVLAEFVVNKIKNQEYKKAIIDAIRNTAEIKFIKENLKNFFLISVDASPEVRFERMKERNRESDPKNWEEFLKVDSRDKGIGESDFGQATGQCMGMADFVLMNNSTKEEAKKRLEEIYEEIDRKIERPSWDEYFMDITRTVAERATCNRGRSGCVITKDKHILVTGYVGSPVGLPHCDEIGHQMKTTIHEDGSQSQHCVRTAHAEQNAICQAAKLGIPLEGATLYCKMTPCSICAKMIINVGIKKVICEKKYHMGQESEEMFRQAGIWFETMNEEIEKYKNQ